MTALDRIQKFSTYKDGWRFGEEGVAFSPAILAKATGIYHRLSRWGFNETNAFPGTDGSIEIVVYGCGQDLEIIVEPDGSLTFYKNEY